MEIRERDSGMRLVLSKAASVFKRDNETITFMLESRVVNIKGKFVSIFIDYLLPLLDGTKTIEDLLVAMSRFSLPPDTFIKLMSLLIDCGVVATSEASGFSKEETLQYASSRAPEAIRNKKIALIGLSNLGARVALLASILGVEEIVLVDDSRVLPEDVGTVFRTEDIDKRRTEVVSQELGRMNSIIRRRIAQINELENVIESVDIALVLSTYEYENYTLPKIVNQVSLGKHKPWIYGAIRQKGDCIIGPLFKPFETACYECMLMRIKSNSDIAEELSIYETAVYSPKTINSKVCFSPYVETVAGLIVNEVWKYLSHMLPSRIVSQFIRLNMETFSLDCHHVLRVPRCPSCTPIGMGPFEKIWNDEIIEVERMLL